MNYSWKVSVQKDVSTLNTHVFIYMEKPDGSVDILQDNKVVSVKRGAIEKPSLILQNDLLQALFEALSSSGMKLPDTSLIAGKLIATEKHLEDMRTLVFNKQS